jgi:glucose/arabinose dehydrogenase
MTTEQRPSRKRREELPDPPLLALTNYPRMLAAYARRGEDGLSELEEKLRTKAARQPRGKFSKGQALYTPFVPLPPLDWRHKCGHCRFWVDHGPGKAGECMIVGREGDRWGGKSIHEDAGCALFVPPAGESAFEWFAEQRDPTGADLVRGEFHPGMRESRERESPGTADQQSQRARGRRRARRTESDLAVGNTSIPAGTRVDLEPVATGLSAPIDLAVAPDGDRRFVADQAGQVYAFEDGDGRAEPLLDLSQRTVELRSQYDERGLLGLALHPEFDDNGRLFVRYSAKRREGTPAEYDHTEVLAEFVTDGEERIDPADERTIMEVPHPEFNHNAGDLAFGPDGYLYLGMGDGGGEGDTGFGHVPGGNGQDVTENLLGGILRIDVDGGVEEGYGVPEDNPLVGEEGRNEYYAWGLRNPWKLSFDSDGRLFVADVGQHLFEEVNVVEKGGNYGWNLREGFHCFDPENPSDPPADCPEENDRGEPLRDPILEYRHVEEDSVVGSAIVGGYVYEGEAIPELEGAYVFGDWATSQDKSSGRLFAASEPEGGDSRWEMEELVVSSTDNGRPNANVLAFGQDRDGELYVLTNETHVPKGETGAVWKVVPPSG